MAVTEYYGVVINNLTLAQYMELKAANQIVASQAYVITDLDEQLEALKMPPRLDGNVCHNQILNNGIDNVETGFYFWDCNSSQYRAEPTQQYYYAYSSVYLDEYNNLAGSQIAIAENTNQMFIRTLRCGDQYWSKWKRILDNYSDQSWQVKVGKLIPVNGMLNFNQNTVDMSSLYLNTDILKLRCQNGYVYNLRLVNSTGEYKLQMIYTATGTANVIASGTSLSAMTFNIEYLKTTAAECGDYTEILDVRYGLEKIIDNIIRINNKNF